MLCHNRLVLSKRCLESYLDTISVSYELLIVNNASTDATSEWLEGIRKDTRIRNIIHREQNDPAAALNTALAMCTGRYLHIMENDYIYRDGWDTYVLDCFDRIPNLGQLCICSGAPRLIGSHHKELVYLSTDNVVSSSVFPRALFFDQKIRWQNTSKGFMPADKKFSDAVKRAGFLVAWPDRRIAESVGFSRKEFERDPDYYIKSYKRKLPSVRVFLTNMLRSRRDWRTIKRLTLFYWIKVKAYFTSSIP